MPSGRVHDAVTLVLAAPITAIAYWASGSTPVTLIGVGAFLFGGLMFGPDLDTISRPYTRWGPARGLWVPYRYFFPHRSRFSHGLLFGALFRVIYFLGVVTLLFIFSAFIFQTFAGGRAAGLSDISLFWERTGRTIGRYSEMNIRLILFAGLWAGAASHTFTDMAGSFIKTGRSGKFF